MKFAFYNQAGQIVSELIAPEESFAQFKGGDFIQVDEGVSSETHFVDTVGLQPQLKSEIDTDFAVSGLTVYIPNLPEGTEVLVDGLSLVISDFEGVQVDFEAPGVYVFEITPLPQYKEKIMEIAVG